MLALVSPVRNSRPRGVNPVRQRAPLRVHPRRATTAPIAGQMVFTSGNGSGNTFTVPAGVRRISAVAVAPGGNGGTDPNYKPGGGGGELRYRNEIPVTPGEVLSIRAPVGGSLSGFRDAYIRRGSTDLLRAKGGVSGNEGGSGGGGSGGSGGTGDGGGNGGAGGSAASGAGAAGGGGAGGYDGDGGKGADTSEATGAQPEADSGGGIGGDRFGGGTQEGYGGGVGLLGLTKDRAPGSEGEPKYGGGGRGFDGVGQNGAVRILWGKRYGRRRSFPFNAADV